jgi:uncharacterized OB-fold protein
MSIKLEKVVQKFYDGLEEGKFLGRKCPKCGAVEFPPVYACNTCGSLETEWVEISGKAVMKSIVMPAALSSKPEYAQMGAFAYGEVEIEEGACFNAVVKGINKKKRREIMENGKLPVPVHAEIFQRNGYKIIVFALDEE